MIWAPGLWGVHDQVRKKPGCTATEDRQRGVKFQIKKGEGLYNQYSKNIDADQLPGYRKADLRLCFRIC